MYAFLTGTIDDKDENIAVVNVGGVGYEVWVSSYTSNTLSIGEIATVYTYLHVREDAMMLFGFSTKQEKAIFKQYQTNLKCLDQCNKELSKLINP